jgi:hypothetical protein
MSKPMNVRTKKLLVAAVGVASVSYLACSSSDTTGASGGDASADATNDALVSSGNLVAPLPEASPDVFMSSGNLVAPLPEGSTDAPADAPKDAQGDALQDVFIGSGNLVAPLPDAGVD